VAPINLDSRNLRAKQCRTRCRIQSLPPASPQDSFSALAAIGQPPDAVRPGPDGKECARLCEHGVMSVHPCPTISACAPHCNNSCTTAGRDEDVAHMMGQKPIIRRRRVGHTALIDVRGCPVQQAASTARESSHFGFLVPQQNASVHADLSNLENVG
jgi:hypothetical protein